MQKVPKTACLSIDMGVQLYYRNEGGNNMNYQDMKAIELKKIAKELKVKNYGSKTKAELIKAIVEIEAERKEEPKKRKPSKNAVLFEYKGQKKNIPDWAREYGMPKETLYSRINTSKWPIEKALTTPVKRKVKEQ